VNTPQMLHTREQFSLTARAPLAITWPLFGAEAERAWAPGWEPIFVWPETAGDREGMVFRTTHGGRTAVWVNTAMDRNANRIQYVYVIPDVVVTVITLSLAAHDRMTDVEVVYERTALAAEANQIVQGMAACDRTAGEEWEGQINGYLQSMAALK
jgi:hypothetical protein